jgi:hypothetical protein
MMITVASSVFCGAIRLEVITDTYSYMRIDEDGLDLTQHLLDAKVIGVDSIDGNLF